MSKAYIGWPSSKMYTGCPKKTPKTIENDLLLQFQCLALN